MNEYAYPWDDEIMAEVRQNKAHLLEKYGGIEGLHKHMEEDRPRLEKEGWRFLAPEEVEAIKHHHII